jgi:hypothetical protein
VVLELDQFLPDAAPDHSCLLEAAPSVGSLAIVVASTSLVKGPQFILVPVPAVPFIGVSLLDTPRAMDIGAGHVTTCPSAA